MFLLPPDVDTHSGDLQAQVFKGKSVLLADTEEGSFCVRSFWEILRLSRDSGTPAAHGLSRNDRETEVFHSPRVSRLWCRARHLLKKR